MFLFPQREVHRRAMLLSALLLLLAGVPLSAAVTTVYSCPSSGNSGNHDYVFNGFYVQNLTASSIHSVTIYYRTDQAGTYTLNLTARVGTYTGTPVGSTLSQTVSLSSSVDTPVTWDFGDVPFPSGSTITFT
ncbi:MAG TPA: hypothetical protein VMM92_00455, partial [Thermoanaerobaculia bacterium]|nr:hypothetical protein [Thermoanaerobaculia bacterium]